MTNSFVIRTEENNPLDGVDLGSYATPKLIDFDGDGDLDLVAGSSNSISFLENVGGPTQPQFVQRTGQANPFDGIVGSFLTPSLADLDGDGKIDTAVVGDSSGKLSYFTYEGDRFIEQVGSANPFDGVQVSGEGGPEFVDLNGDGKLDLVVGDQLGSLNFFLNQDTGFTQQTEGDNPFNGMQVGPYAKPTFLDIDQDGDLDAFIGEDTGKINYFENTGTATAPTFTERLGEENPFDGLPLGSGLAPTFGDLDGDGDVDALIGKSDGRFTYLENSPTISIKPGDRTLIEVGSVSGAFVVTLSEPAPEGGLIVEYTVGTGQYEALPGIDYQPLTGSVAIAAGETTAIIEVVPINDQERELIEKVTVTLSPTEGYLSLPGEETAFLTIIDDERSAHLAEIVSEPNFKDQWHLLNTAENLGTPGMDLNLLKVWQDYSGKGVKVGVVDDGVEATHPDLVDNYDPSPNPEDPLGFFDGWHGTAVAGIIAAKAGNDLGGVGVAHNATLTSFNIFDFEADLAESLRMQMAMDVSNNSWGFILPFRADFAVDDVEMGRAIQEVAEKGRNGLGTVFVFAAGNSQAQAQMSNYSNLTNSRYTISVAALTAEGEQTSYSSQGADILVSAFGSENGDVFSTDRVGEPGYDPGDYTFGFSGTSAATPMVSGVVALMLEANSQLGYRDVQEILAYSARWNDADNVSWGLNSANNWNGGGLHYSLDYGFGLVDALAAVRLAETWQTQHTAANEQRVTATSAPSLAIPDMSLGGVKDTITIDSGLRLDHVEVELEVNHDRYADLIVTLTSPTGVVSELVNQPRFYDADKVDGQNFTFTFSRTFDWGETGVGDWTLNVIDARTSKTGSFNNWTLNLYGDQLTADDTYIYTDEFAHAKLTDPVRQVLNDTNGGSDILNAAAVTSDLHLDLTPGGEDSMIAGKRLSLASKTLIETAFGGDGDDLILGNLADNTLHSGRGKDTIAGGLGNDTLFGDAGDDLLWGDLNSQTVGEVKGGDDLLYGGAGNDTIVGQGGHDKLFGDGGTDFLYGDVGDDWLTGGAGDDVLSGGDGADIFAVAVNQGIDIISDFKIGIDMIELLGEISFGQTIRIQQQQDTLLTFENQTLALIQNISADQLTADSFLSV